MVAHREVRPPIGGRGRSLPVGDCRAERVPAKADVVMVVFSPNEYPNNYRTAEQIDKS
jgi:hypothetical protein